MATTFPLCWPEGCERTGEPILGARRPRGALGRVEVVGALDELGTLTGTAATEVRLSSNETSARSRPADGGAAVWFEWDGATRCIAYDLYAAPEANFAAIAQLVKACVAEFGRGGLAGVRHALSSFTPAATRIAIPASGWQAVLGVGAGATREEIAAAFRRRALTAHPDHGGDRRAWDELIAAYRAGQGKATMLDSSNEGFEWMSDDGDAQDSAWHEILNGLGGGGAR